MVKNIFNLYLFFWRHYLNIYYYEFQSLQQPGELAQDKRFGQWMDFIICW